MGCKNYIINLLENKLNEDHMKLNPFHPTRKMAICIGTWDGDAIS